MKNVKLINTSRGPTLDQEYLIEAINNGNVYAAALDVTDPEPPDYKSEIINHPKVLVTPHIGSATNETFKKMAMMAAQNITNALEGKEMVSQVKL
jgi:phosphoglycerate dehydrogenase-like enzyme